MLVALIRLYDLFVDSVLAQTEGLAALALRLYLGPIFILAGWGKLSNFENTAVWFGDPEFGLGLPFPDVMAALAGGTEFFGGILLVVGLAVRLISVPLFVTMVVAAITAHLEFGWHALPEAHLTMPWEWRTDLIEMGIERKEIIKDIVREHGNYAWLTEPGAITILKNGVEFAVTYMIMLMALIYLGGGRYVSADYFVQRFIAQRIK